MTLAARLVVAGARTRPRGEVSSGLEAAHVGANLGPDPLCCSPVDAGHSLQQLDLRRERAMTRSISSDSSVIAWSKKSIPAKMVRTSGPGRATLDETLRVVLSLPPGTQADSFGDPLASLPPRWTRKAPLSPTSTSSTTRPSSATSASCAPSADGAPYGWRGLPPRASLSSAWCSKGCELWHLRSISQSARSS